MVVRVVLLVVSLIVVCSAGSSPLDAARVGPFSKAVLLGRGLSQQKRGFYNNGCPLEKCWDVFYKNAFKNIETCRDSLSVLKECLKTEQRSADMCVCNFDQVQRSMQEIDGQMCESIFNTNYGRCVNAKTEACAGKMKEVTDLMNGASPPTAEQRTSVHAAVKSCLEEVIKDGLSTAGCEYFFPKSAGDLDFALNYMATDAWGQGCEDMTHIVGLCPSPKASSVSDCSDNNSDVQDFVNCAKKELSSQVCQNFLSNLTQGLKTVKDAACGQISKVQETISKTCGADQKRREIVRSLLKLLTSKRK